MVDARRGCDKVGVDGRFGDVVRFRVRVCPMHLFARFLRARVGSTDAGDRVQISIGRLSALSLDLAIVFDIHPSVSVL